VSESSNVTPPATPGRLDYGDHPEQHLVLSGPAIDPAPPLGTVALLHGGYWRGAFTRTLMDPMTDDLTARGWSVANIEYRRVDAGGGWPLPLTDTVAACRLLLDRIREGRLAGPLVLLGHSVGGQLALLAARELATPEIAGILALAPVTDVLETWRQGLGDDAATGLLAGIDDPEPVAIAASPVHRLPIGTRATLVHGLDDARVPHAHSVRFTAAARAEGDAIRLISPERLEHRAAIDPAGEHWPSVVDELVALHPAPPPRD